MYAHSLPAHIWRGCGRLLADLTSSPPWYHQNARQLYISCSAICI